MVVRTGPPSTAPQLRPTTMDEILAATKDPDRVREGIEALAETELARFGLDFFHMNFLAIFGDEWPTEDIRRSAARATRNKLFRGWEYYKSYLEQLAGDHSIPARPRLARLDTEAARNLLDGGNGLVICSFHLGSYRDIPTDLALSGMPCTMPLDAAAYADYMNVCDTTRSSLVRSIEAVNVEDPAGVRALARTLKRGGFVFAYIDGNTGQDGPLGEESRTEVELLGYRVRVKNGLLRLAARFGSPVLPMMTVQRGAVGTVVADPVLQPSGRLKGSEQSSFVDEAVRKIYRFFEKGILEQPEQWETGCFFHRWRAGAGSPQSEAMVPVEEARREVEEALCSGKALEMDRRRIVRITNGEEKIWTDARTLRSYKAPGDLAPALDQLSSADGLGRSWLDIRQQQENGDSTARLFSYLAFLRSRNAIVEKRVC